MNLTWHGVTVSLKRAKKGENLLDFLARMTRGHEAMCPCNYCLLLRRV